MKKQVGIRVRGLPSLAELLYFDEITLVNRNVTEESPEECAQIEYLTENKVLVDPTKFLDRPESVITASSTEEHVKRLFVEALAIAASDKGKQQPRSAQEERKAEELIPKIECRIDQLLALPLRRAIEVHPEYEPTTIFYEPASISSYDSVNSVLEVIIKKLPVPTRDTPLQSVLLILLQSR